MNIIYLVMIIAAITASLLTQRDRLSSLARVIILIVLVTYTSSLPALAARHVAALGAPDSAITSEQQRDEDFKLTPGAGQYSGLEYPDQQSGTPLSDSEITRKIKSETKNLVVNSANGSVILSGTVKDQETARQIVEQVKQIPGVREITFELGLQNSGS